MRTRQFTLGLIGVAVWLIAVSVTYSTFRSNTVVLAFVFLIPLVAIWLFFVPRVLARSVGAILLGGWATIMVYGISQLEMFE